jgi:hypothetical protein
MRLFISKYQLWKKILEEHHFRDRDKTRLHM